MIDEIGKAVKILQNSGIVVYPTDTAFGVGCRMDDKKAVERLFRLRRRPKTQAVPVLVDSLKMAQDYLEPIQQEVVEKLIKPYWPGALTLILPCVKQKVSYLVRGGAETLGVRWPDHPVPQKLIKGIGVPILGPSANFHGEKTPYKYEYLDPEFLKGVDFILFGECPVGMVSTIINCSQKPWRIIRQGGIRINLSIK